MMVAVIGILPELSIAMVVVIITMVEDMSVISTGEAIAVVIMLSVILGKVLFTGSGNDDVIMTVLVGLNGTMLLIISVNNVNTSTGVIIEFISGLITSTVDIGIKAVLMVLLANGLSTSTVAVVGLMDDEILSDIVVFIMSTGDILMMVLSFCAAVSK